MQNSLGYKLVKAKIEKSTPRRRSGDATVAVGLEQIIAAVPNELKQF